jgi:hypothetical protein
MASQERASPALRRVQRWGDAWLWLGGPTPRGSAGITLGRLVIVSPHAVERDDLAGLLTHEFAHVRQWRELGTVRFAWRYLSSYARWRIRGYGHWAAYRRIPLEIEARWATRSDRWDVSALLRADERPGPSPNAPHLSSGD